MSLRCMELQVGFECGDVVLERKGRESGKGRKVRSGTRGQWNVVLKKKLA